MAETTPPLYAPIRRTDDAKIGGVDTLVIHVDGARTMLELSGDLIMLKLNEPEYDTRFIVRVPMPAGWTLTKDSAATDAEIEAYHKDQRTFPPGCSCERINVDTFADVPGTQFIRGRSDPPCKVHLPEERALYDVAYERGFQAGGGLER